MKEKMKSCGAGDYELQEMEGGGDAGGGAFASLDSTPGRVTLCHQKLEEQTLIFMGIW